MGVLEMIIFCLVVVFILILLNLIVKLVISFKWGVCVSNLLLIWFESIVNRVCVCLVFL